MKIPKILYAALPPVVFVAKKAADKIKEAKEKEKAKEEKISKLERDVERLQSLIENDK